MNTAPRPFPLVVHLGFAGSRRLLDPAHQSGVDEARFLAEVEAWLVERLTRLPAELGLSPSHFLCGMSQVAVGADMVFTRACRDLEIPQRIVLPQSRDEYLAGIGSDEAPDFTAAEKRAAIELLASSHVIQERVVSDAENRHDHFEDVNFEIARASDVVICLLRAEAGGKPGGTFDLRDRAASRNKPVLEITVAMVDGRPDMSEVWRWNKAPDTSASPDFTPPSLPPALIGITVTTAPQGVLPDVTAYCVALKARARAKAKQWQWFFKLAALLIIGTHVIATILAVVAFANAHESWIPRVLIGEIALLGSGFAVHHLLRKSEAVQTWAVSRVVAEIARSVLAIGQLRVVLDYLVNLPFHNHLRALVRTIEVLHLHSTRAARGRPWEPLRDHYVTRRITDPHAQLDFYERRSRHARNWLLIAHGAFVVFSLGAIGATAFELYVASQATSHDAAASCLCSSFAIVLPVLAVAALSLAAAFDLEARAHTFTEMYRFLGAQLVRLQGATSERQFARLLLETESQLLGETANWFFRRSFTSVA